MKIMLREYKTVSLVFQKDCSDSSKDGDDSFEFGMGHVFPEESDKLFSVGLKIALTHQGYRIELEMRFIFETDAEITDDFKSSNFPIVNAPAIAFPYLRSFVSVFTLQAGFKPLFLPSVNFVELAKSKR